MVVDRIRDAGDYEALRLYREKQKKRVGEPPVCLKCLLRTTGQATIAPNALLPQDRIRLQEPALSLSIQGPALSLRRPEPALSRALS